MVDLVLEADDAGSVPDWIAQEAERMTGEIAEWLADNLDDDNTLLGTQLIRLSSLQRAGGCMYAVLGLASMCIQPCEQGGEVNPKIPALLDSQLAIFDILPRSDWPDFAWGWRELAIRRVEILVRLDLGRRVGAIQSRYVEALQTASLIHVYEPARHSLNTIRRHLPLLVETHQVLSKYVPLLEDDRELSNLRDDLEIVTALIEEGHRVLDIPRR